MFETAWEVEWDQWRFAAQVHQQCSMFQNGGPALEASWFHPTVKQVMTLIFHQVTSPFDIRESELS